MQEPRLDTEALRRCVARARRAPFYASRLPAASQLDTATFRAWPLTHKRDLQRHGPAAFLVAPTEGALQYHETFGTTGPPAGSWFSRRDYTDDLHRARHWSAPFTDRRVLIRFPYALSMPAHLAQRAALERASAVVGASSRDTVCPHARAVRLIPALGISVIACSPFEALLLAETAEALGVDTTPVEALCVAGELLSDAYRTLLTDAWSVPVRNLYGSTETGALASSCCADRLHVCDGQLVEIVDEHDASRPAPAGEVGRVVVTTVDREAMPLVRWATGDLASWLPEGCACDRDTPALELHGRFRLPDGGTERDLQQAACTAAREVGGRFLAAEAGRTGLEVRVEASPSRTHTTHHHGRPMVVRCVPRGSLIDRNALLAGPAARKPRLVDVRDAPPAKEVRA